MNKIIIIGNESIDKINIAKLIVSKNDNLTIVPRFSTDVSEDITQINDLYTYFLNPNIINLSYKNNSLLFVTTKNYVTWGVTIDDFYNNDILCCEYNEFNNISNVIFDTYDILTIWIDSSQDKTKNDLNEAKFIGERLQNYKYLYYLNESKENITDEIIRYLDATEDEQNEIIFNNN